MAIEYEETQQPVRGRIEYETEPAAPKAEKGLMDRAKDVATSAGFGAVAGAFSPEIASLSGQVLEKVPYKPVQMAGRAMKSASIGMDTGKQRALGFLAGGFSGATGETAGQVAELAGAPGYVSESARILGSLAPVEILSSTARGVSGLLRSVSPTAANTRMLLQSVMDDVGAANLAGAKREEVMRRINELRQAPFTTDAQKKLYDVIAKDVQTMTGTAAQEAQALERSGTREGLEAQRRAKGFASLGGEVSETKATILQRAKDSLRNLGDATRELSDVGRTLRDSIVARFDEQSLIH